MPLLIDGYNLLHMAGIIGGGRGPGGLERSRLALLNFLAETLSERELVQTVVVFDSREAPWGAPSRVEHRGIEVLFASRYPDADCLIEELIRENSSPRRLTVVSSDHRLQRAARRRRAKAIDSEVWYQDLLRLRQVRNQSAPQLPERPAAPLLAEDVEYWVRQFGGHSELERWMKEELSVHENRPIENPPNRNPPDKKIEEPPAETPELSKDGKLLDLSNPFPPGYGEDVEENSG